MNARKAHVAAVAKNLIKIKRSVASGEKRRRVEIYFLLLRIRQGGQMKAVENFVRGISRHGSNLSGSPTRSRLPASVAGIELFTANR